MRQGSYFTQAERAPSDASAAELREEKQNSYLPRVIIVVQFAAKHTEEKQEFLKNYNCKLCPPVYILDIYIISR